MSSCCQGHSRDNKSKSNFKEKTSLRGLSDYRLMIFGSLVILLIFGGVIWGVLSDKSTSASSGAPKIVIEPQRFDAGEISMAQGLYTETVMIKNEGDAPLKISGIQTSCMCTTAALEVNGQKSPSFGMPGHGGTPFWGGMEIAPGSSGALEIVFDPLAHGPEATGKVIREIYLRTNDPNTSEAVVSFTANVMK